MALDNAAPTSLSTVQWCILAVCPDLSKQMNMLLHRWCKDTPKGTLLASSLRGKHVIEPC
jgi:hypothetical protein